MLPRPRRLGQGALGRCAPRCWHGTDSTTSGPTLSPPPTPWPPRPVTAALPVKKVEGELNKTISRSGRRPSRGSGVPRRPLRRRQPWWSRVGTPTTRVGTCFTTTRELARLLRPDSVVAPCGRATPSWDRCPNDDRPSLPRLPAIVDAPSHTHPWHRFCR
jgi:hypothetical protein